MLDTRRLALEGWSETSSAAYGTDVSGGGGGDLDGQINAFFCQVDTDIETERMRKDLRELRAEKAAAWGAKLATVTSVVPTSTGAAPAAASTVEQKPKKTKRTRYRARS